jgi:hypothetical protein
MVDLNEKQQMRDILINLFQFIKEHKGEVFSVEEQIKSTESLYEKVGEIISESSDFSPKEKAKRIKKISEAKKQAIEKLIREGQPYVIGGATFAEKAASQGGQDYKQLNPSQESFKEGNKEWFDLFEKMTDEEKDSFLKKTQAMLQLSQNDKELLANNLASFATSLATEINKMFESNPDIKGKFDNMSQEQRENVFQAALLSALRKKKLLD